MPDTYLAKARGLFSAPREPVLQEAGLMDDLVAKACILCSRPSRRNNTQPGYGMKRGEKVLLGVDSSYDWRVVEAMKAAAGELGAKMDIIMVDSGGPQRSVYHITETPLDGADEARSVQRSIGTDIRRNPYLVREIADKHNYDLVINGTAGPIPDTAYRWERLPWTTVEHWAGEEIAFPIELQVAIDSVVWEQIQRCVRVRFTDPEGTDVTFSNYNDGRWMYQSHQWGKPLYITAEEDATGVIAGTTNHRGVFQWCEPYLYRVAEWFAAGRGLVLVMALLVTVDGSCGRCVHAVVPGAGSERVCRFLYDEIPAARERRDRRRRLHRLRGHRRGAYLADGRWHAHAVRARTGFDVSQDPAMVGLRAGLVRFGGVGAGV